MIHRCIPNAYPKAALTTLLLTGTLAATAQTGTYEKKNPHGAYCVISYRQTGSRVQAEIFAWWNTSGAQMGSYQGAGIRKDNQVLLHSTLNDPACKVTLTLAQGKLHASFNDCSIDHLPDDFNGSYTLITRAVAGEYIVAAPKAWFYKSPVASARLNAYVVKGDKVRLDIDRIGASRGDWLYVYFTGPSGKETSGYIPAADLKRLYE